MKRKRYSVEQIVAILKQAELGLPVPDLIRQMQGRMLGFEYVRLAWSIGIGG